MGTELGFPGLGVGVGYNVTVFSVFLDGFFLISVLHPSAVIPHLESLDLVKVFLCMDSFQINVSVSNAYTTILLIIPQLI